MNASKCAVPCGDCICNHCANSVECLEAREGEAKFACFTCDECRQYDRLGTDNWKSECAKYRITDSYAKRIRKKFMLIS